MQAASQTVTYKPFGTFLLCSEFGSTCLEDPDEVSELLVPVGLETTRNHNSNEDWLVFYYTGIVERLESFVIFKGISKLGELIVHPVQAGVILQLEAIGVERTQPNNEINALIATMERRKRFVC